jgi:hypothetical protein
VDIPTMAFGADADHSRDGVRIRNGKETTA